MKRYALFVLAFVLTLCCFSCSKNEIKRGDVDQSLTAEDLDIAGVITLTVDNGSGTEEEAMACRAVIRSFEATFPNAKVKYEESSRGTFAARISSGDIGDVFWVDENDMANYQRNHNALMPLDSYLKPLGINMGDIYIGAIDCGRFKGRLYMAPRNMGESVMTFNKDMLQSAGIDYDGSYALDWETFKDYCRRMTVTGADGNYEQVGAGMRIFWTVIWQMFMRGFGGEWINSKEHRITIVDSNEVMQGLNEMINAVQEGWLYPEDVAPSLTGQLKQRFSHIPGSDSDYAYVCFKTFIDMSGLTTVGNAYKYLDIDWDFCPFPAFPTHNISTGATGYVVYNRTSYPDTAAAFALHFLTESGQRAYHSQTGGGIPLLKSLAEEDFWKAPGTEWADKNYDVFLMYDECTRPATVIVQVPSEISEIFSNAAMVNVLASILNGKQDIQTAFGTLQRKANETWATLYDG